MCVYVCECACSHVCICMYVCACVRVCEYLYRYPYHCYSVTLAKFSFTLSTCEGMRHVKINVFVYIVYYTMYNVRILYMYVTICSYTINQQR